MKTKVARKRTGSPEWTAILDRSPAYALPRAGTTAPVELQGRLARSESDGKAILLIRSPNEWGELAVEFNSADVLKAALVFEDSAGRRTYRLQVAGECALRPIFRAADFAARILVEKEQPRQEPLIAWRADLERPDPQDPYSVYAWAQPAPGAAPAGADLPLYQEVAFGPPE